MKLKRCPFCRGSATIQIRTREPYVWHAVVCVVCACATQETMLGAASCIKRWNTRPAKQRRRGAETRKNTGPARR